MFGGPPPAFSNDVGLSFDHADSKASKEWLRAHLVHQISYHEQMLAHHRSVLASLECGPVHPSKGSHVPAGAKVTKLSDIAKEKKPPVRKSAPPPESSYPQGERPSMCSPPPSMTHFSKPTAAKRNTGTGLPAFKEIPEDQADDSPASSPPATPQQPPPGPRGPPPLVKAPPPLPQQIQERRKSMAAEGSV